MTRAITRRAFARLAGGGVLAGALPAPAVVGQARPRLVVVGGGAGGLSVARTVAEGGGIDVTVIEPHPSYAACFWNNHVLGGLDRIDAVHFGYDGVRAAGIAVVEDRALGIDREKRRVRLAGGGAAAYDRLVLSPGISFAGDAIEGYDAEVAKAMPHAYTSDPGQLRRLYDQLRAMPENGQVLISVPPPPMRCPPAPYERAGLIARWMNRHKPRGKVLVLDASNGFPQQEIVQRAWNDVAPGMVEWLPSDFIGRVGAVDARDGALLTDFDRFRGDVVNLIPPQRAGRLALEAGLADDAGWCPVAYPEMRSRRDWRVFVVGDSVDADTMPKSATAANSQATGCAGAVRQDLLGIDAPSADLHVTCYAFLDDERAIAQGADYRPTADGGVERVDAVMAADDEGDQVRRERAQAAKAWYAGLTGRLFGA